MRSLFALSLLCAGGAWAQFTTLGSFGVGARGSQYLVLYAEVQVSLNTGEGAGRVFGQLYDADGGLVGARVELDPTPGDQGGSGVLCGRELCLLTMGTWSGNNFTPSLRALRADAGLGDSTPFDAGVALESCSGVTIDGGFLFACEQGNDLRLHTLSESGVWQRAVTVTTPNRYGDGWWRLVPGARSHLLAYTSDWQPGGMTSSRFLVLDAQGATISAQRFTPPLAAPSWHLAAVPDGWLGWFLATQPNQPLQPYAFRPDGGFTTLFESPGPGARDISGAGVALFDGRDVVLAQRHCTNPNDCLESFQASIARSDVNGRFVDAQWVPLTTLAPTSEPLLATLGNGQSLAVFSAREEEPTTHIYLHQLHTQVLRRGAALRGAACVTGSDCADGFCASGVCCDTQCAGGCQTCRASEGAAADGVCTPRAANVVCRATAQRCELAARCDGTAAECPANASVPDGGACDDGDPLTLDDVCGAGVCRGEATSTDAGPAPFDAGVGPFFPPDAGVIAPPDAQPEGCGGCGATGVSPWWGVVLLWATRRRRGSAS